MLRGVPPRWTRLAAGVAASVAAAAVATRVLVVLHRKGPYLSLRERLFGATKDDYVFGCEVCSHPALQKVLDVFEAQFLEGALSEAQLCVLSRGRRVLDTWGQHAARRAAAPYNADTTQNIFSCSKVITNTVIAILVDRGLLAYDDPIVKYWPEFARREPERARVTISDCLRHTARLPCYVQGTDRIPLSCLIPPEGPHAAKAHYQRNMEQVLIEASSEAVGAGQCFYHAITTSTLLNAVLTRADPHGRTVQDLWELHTRQQGLEVDYYCGRGYPPRGCKSVCDVRTPPAIWSLFHIFVPHYWQRLVRPDAPEVQAKRMQMAAMEDTSGYFHRNALPIVGWDKLHQRANNQPFVHDYEASTTNGVASARALAAVAAVHAGKGRSGDVTLMREDTWQKMMRPGEEMWDVAMFQKMRWTQGGMFAFPPEDLGGEAGFYGWSGWGGSLMVFHPEKEVSIALTMTGVKHIYSDETRWGPLIAAICSALRQM